MITEIFAPLSIPVDDLSSGPLLILKDVTPIYLKVNFIKWCEISLQELDRSRIPDSIAIKHVSKEFIGLIDAVFCLILSIRDDELADNFSDHIRRYIDSYYKKDIKNEDILPPPDFCKVFFTGIAPDSAISALWILMELVATYKDKYDYHLDEATILDLYSRYSAIIAVGHNWKKIISKYYKGGINSLLYSGKIKRDTRE
jgi:hypothetical protein